MAIYQLLVLCTLLTACGQALPAQEKRDLFQVVRSQEDLQEKSSPEPVVILLSHSATEDRPTHQAALYFKQQVEELSEESLYVEIYPNDTLGNVLDNADAFSSGSVQMRIGLGDSIPLMQLCVLAPALGSLSLQELNALFQEGELRALLEEQYADNGMMLLEIMPPEYRYLACDQAINTSEDFRLLNLRVPVEKDASTRYWRALGAQTTVVDIKQLRIMLQQGAVNAHESTLPVMIGQRLYPYLDYLIQIPHRIYFDTMIMNLDFFQRLTQEQQEAVRLAAAKTRTFYQAESEAYLARNDQLLEDAGVQYLQLSEDLAELLQKNTAQYELPDLYQKLGPELYDRVVALLSGGINNSFDSSHP